MEISPVVAPGFPSKTKDPLPPHIELFHDAVVGAKNVHWEPMCDLVDTDIVYREVSRVALTVTDIVFVPFLQRVFDVLEIVVPNAPGCQPEKPDFWENEGSWPLPDDLIACGETWRDIIDDNNLDGGVDDGVWDCWREWIALQLNRAAGVLPPQSILDASDALLAIIEDCVVSGAEEDDFDDYCEDLEKFNDEDNNGLGYDCLLGVFPADCTVAFSYFLWRVSFVDGIEAFAPHARLVAVVCSIEDLFSDPDNDATHRDLTLLLRGPDHFVYTLRDAVQPAIEQRAQSA